MKRVFLMITMMTFVFAVGAQTLLACDMHKGADQTSAETTEES